MSLGVCIPDLIARGEVPEAKAKAVREFYDARVADYQRDMAPAAAEALATEDALKWLSAEVLAKTRQRGLQVRAQKDWFDRMRAAAGDDGVLPVGVALDRMARIDKQRDAIRGRLFSTLDGLLARHRRNLLGELRNKAELEPIGRALAGEAVGDLNARELAQSLGEVMEIARQRFNQAGGRIGKRENYIPQSHDARAVRAVPFEQWREFGPVDRIAVLDLETGEPARGLRRETLLREVYETIRSEGASKREPGQQMGTGALANRRADPRVLHFENYDDWIEYQQRFGTGDTIYDIVGTHLSGMARDIAMMEAMGPNPAATLRFVQDAIEQNHQVKGSQRQVDTLNRSTGKLGRLYDQLAGNNNVAEDVRLAKIGSGFRAWQVSAKLGSAMLSAVVDLGTMLHTARYNRLPIMRTVGEYIKLWNPADDGDRRLAVRLGLVTDDWIGLSSSSNRYLGEELTGEVSRRLADAVIRAQGLSRHTRNAQWATGMNFIATFTHMKDRSFGQLDPAMQRQMQRYDLGEAEWDKYRATPGRIERGIDWIAPADVADARVGDRFLEMILTETDHAVVTPDIRTQTGLNAMLKPGTPAGEIGRSMFLFKGFPMAIISLHGRRMLEQPGLAGKAGYAVPLLLAMTAWGALSAQLKLIAAGKDPQPMDDPKFVGKAVAQSGGLGLFGDLLYNSENSYGGGLTATLAGPMLGQTIPNFADATVGNAKRALDGDPKTEAKWAKGLWRSVEAEIPGRNLWYTRLAWERLVTDQIDALVDPDIEAARRRMAKRAAQEGTEFFWEPGQGAPLRAPNLANATEGRIPE